jgi:putative aldouronate transport system permease protein
MKFLKSDKFIDSIFVIILIIVGLLCIYPIWYILIASVSEPNAVLSGDVLFWPVKFTMDGYKELMEYPQLFVGFRNTIIYMFVGTFISLVVTLPTAYALSRKELKGRRVLNFIFIITMYFNGGLIPTYLLHSTIGWINTVWCLLIPVALNVYNMILARNAFESMPEALHESAQLDGASEFRYFIQFVIPLSKATIAVIFLFCALQWWNEYMRFVIYMDKPNLQSVQVIVRQITTQIESTFVQNEVGGSTAAIMEGKRLLELLKYCVVVVVALPFAIIYPFIQKYFNQGVMIGSVKE